MRVAFRVPVSFEGYCRDWGLYKGYSSLSRSTLRVTIRVAPISFGAQARNSYSRKASCLAASFAIATWVTGAATRLEALEFVKQSEYRFGTSHCHV